MKTILETDSDFICDIQAPCFQMLIPEEAEVVRASKTQVFFRKEDNLTKQGAFASYVLFVINGYAKQYLEGAGTKNYNLRIIKPGEFIGLSSVFSENTFNYSSLALTDCQVFLIEKDALGKVIKQNGMFGFNIIKLYMPVFIFKFFGYTINRNAHRTHASADYHYIFVLADCFFMISC